MGKLTLGFGLGFVSGVVAVPVAVIIFAENAESIGNNLSRLANVFEKFASEDETAPVEAEPVEAASASAVTASPTELPPE